MDLRDGLTRGLARILIITSLFMLLVGCGEKGNTSRKINRTPSPTQPVIQTTSTQVVVQATPNSSTMLTQRGFDIAGQLHIEVSGVSCAFGNLALPTYSRGNLVFAKSPSTYSTYELQQISSYVHTLISLTNEAALPVPSVLQWIQGGSICKQGLKITNISQKTITIQSIDMRLIASVESNNTQYRLIDICSLLPLAERVSCPGGNGGGNPEYVSFLLRKAPIGTVYHIGAYDAPSIEPGGIFALDIGFYPAHGSPDNLIYNLLPEIVLNTNTFELEQLTEEVSFAAQSQFSCNTFKGNKFISVTPTDIISNSTGSVGQWCL